MKDDQKLRNVLRVKIVKIINEKPKIAVKEISNIMATKYNIDQGRTTYILNDSEPIEKVSYNLLYKLMDSIKVVITNKYSDLFTIEDLNWEDYFYETEKEEYSKPFPKQEEDFDMAVKDYHIIDAGNFKIVTIYPPLSDVYKWHSYNKFHYNPETQRDLIIEDVDGLPIVKLDINWDSVKEMKKAMNKGKYYPITGIANINPEENEDTYYFKGSNFIIPKSVRLDLCDGYHNLIAVTQAKEENGEDWEFPCRFDIVCLNKENVNNIIRQMDKKNHFNEAQVATMDTSEIGYLINTINSSSNFHLNGLCDKNMFLFLYKLIPNLFKIDDSRRNTTQLLNLFIDKLNFIISEKDHFDNIFTKEEWFVYLYLIKLTSEDDIMLENIFKYLEIENILSEINFKTMPLKKHYDILNKKYREVKKNV